MTRKETAKRYIIFLIGLYLNSFGVSFVTKANLGTSPISSIPYVLSLGYKPTLGQFTIIFSFLLIALQIMILGKNFKKENLLQIPVSIFFGYFIDSSMSLLGALNPTFYPWKIVSLLFGCIILGFGVYIEVIANVVMLPGESFVRAVTSKTKTEFGFTKIIFDVSMTLIAAVISVQIFHHLEGIREGTVIAALTVGMFARIFGRKLIRFTKWLFPDTDSAQEDAEDKKENLVVTISREFGSGGREIGKMIAEELGIAYYDAELIQMVAKKSGYTENYVEKHEQKLTNSILYDLYAQYAAYQENESTKYDALYHAESEVINDLAREQSCVIVGRLANFVLKEHKNRVHIFISASMEQKISRVVARDQMTKDLAKDKILKVERERRNHCKYFTGSEWGAAKNYDITVKSSTYGVKETGILLCGMIRRIQELRNGN